MLIDHIGAIGFPYEMSYRLVGRLSFPIFAFLIANGYRHTRDRSKYMLRLVCFAVISEVPFDISFNKAVLEFTRQNIFFTLALGLAGLMLQDKLRKYIPAPFNSACALLITASAAEVSGASYGAVGVVSIFLFDMWMSRKIHMVVLAVVLGASYFSMNWVQFWGVLACIPIYFYNGKPGIRHKALQYGFYLFYPIHMLVLYYFFQL